MVKTLALRQHGKMKKRTYEILKRRKKAREKALQIGMTIKKKSVLIKKWKVHSS